MKKTVIIIQARMGSKRLPGKVMKKILGIPIIGIIKERLSYSKHADEVVVATTREKKNKILIDYLKASNIKYFAGSKNNVLDRYLGAAKKFKAYYVVRITGDCPLIDSKVVDRCIKKIKNTKADYVCNVFPPTYPDGLDVDVFSTKVLLEISKKIKSLVYKEYFPRYLKHNKDKYKIINIKNLEDLSNLRLTVDEIEDFKIVNKIFENFYPNINFSLKSIMDFYKKNKNLFKLNSHLKRNEGSVLTNGQKLWKRATKIIPGGNMLLSKNPNMYLPNKWPTYFKKTSGCYVWDLDGKKYTDVCTMGVGTNTLGYSNKHVDREVVKILKQGTLSTLNCPEEVLLSEKLIEIHPWAEMVKLARTGGEANALAIRIARASTKKYKVAFCGYHGWHDWYLSSTLQDKQSLKFHLFPNMHPTGLPPELKNTTFPFKYGDYEGLKKICEDKDVGIIKMEVCRNTYPNLPFLKKVRDLAGRKNLILIFDECTTGFRQSFGGIHKSININPDMAVFGKALGNGYSITAVIGKREIMENAEKTFASSTFWTERIGPTAAIKTLEVMEKVKSWEQITKKGERIISGWKKISSKYNINLEVAGIPALAKFEIKSKNWMKYKTFITQELLKNKILANNVVYPCTEHKNGNIDNYLYCLDKVFKIIKECELGRSVDKILETHVAVKPFNRLN